MFREEGEPAGSDFAIGPDGDDIGAGSKEGVVVIVHDGVGPDFDGEDGGEVAQSFEQPGFAVGEVPFGNWVISGQEGAADAAAEAMVHPNLTIFDISAAW